MGRYVRQFEITVNVDDEPVTAVLRQATQEELLGLDESSKFTLLKGFRGALGNAIVELRGLTDAAGMPIPKEEFLSSAYFAKAIMEIGEKWIEKATPANPSSPAA